MGQCNFYTDAALAYDNFGMDWTDNFEELDGLYEHYVGTVCDRLRIVY